MEKKGALLNIDSSLESLLEEEITASVVDAFVSSMAFKNLDSVPRNLPHVLEVCTHHPQLWALLIEAADQRYRIKSSNEDVVVFGATRDCGCIRTYRFRGQSIGKATTAGVSWLEVKDGSIFYDILNAPSSRMLFKAWITHLEQVTSIPTIFLDGRLQNTSVEKGVVFSKGDGCVVCGNMAQCYAATTIGSSDAALILHHPVCKEHLETARKHPTILAFTASLFNLTFDELPVEKQYRIPDDVIAFVHQAVADGLRASVGNCVKRERGWNLQLRLDSGWSWLLRINTFNDYAYMLFAPNEKKEKFRADSAPDHPDLPFFPHHEHDNPQKKGHLKKPSFLYGHPLFDLKRLLKAGAEHGAYKQP